LEETSMNRVIPVILAAAASVALMAQTDQMPKRKPGLWEMTMATNDPGAPASPPPMKMCVDAATDAEMYKFSMGQAKQNCSKSDIKSDGTTVVMDGDCTYGASRMTTHATMKFAGDTAYHTDIRRHFDPPLYGRSDTSMTQDGKWVGACPAGMQPGDMIAPNGQKTNMRTMMQQQQQQPQQQKQ
jgi:hypothetical protein